MLRFFVSYRWSSYLLDGGIDHDGQDIVYAESPITKQQILELMQNRYRGPDFERTNFEHRLYIDFKIASVEEIRTDNVTRVVVEQHCPSCLRELFSDQISQALERAGSPL